MQAEVLRKLDAGLLSLVTGAGLDQSAKIAVFVRATSGQLDRVTDFVTDGGGRVRHELKRYSAVAAWVSIKTAADLASQPFVERVEISQQVEIA